MEKLPASGLEKIRRDIPRWLAQKLAEKNAAELIPSPLVALLPLFRV